jgi:ergothioneine biosynthesis protein EgtB
VAKNIQEHPAQTRPSPRQRLLEQFHNVRTFSEHLSEPLEIEDYVIQSMPDVSPTKWHLAHTSWFFETFILEPNLKDYQSPHPQYTYLFNSYYNSVGERHCRANRGLISRPTVQEIYVYRHYIDECMHNLLEQCDDATFERLTPLVTLGINHEQQHQELIVTDIKHVLSCNPLYPAYHTHKLTPVAATPALNWISYPEGIARIGFEGDGFFYDNEGPRHRQFLEPYQLASRLVTNGEYLAFMNDGGYKNPLLWLSMGWSTVQSTKWEAPLYWEHLDGRWHVMTLSGLQEVDLNEPVCHVSYFEADAYARWANARLATEAEWEVAAQGLPLQGNFVESGALQPLPLQAHTHTSQATQPEQMYGDVWEWTQSAYLAYPGYKPAPGAIGEYNGKFMCNQFVLRGGSCATSVTHIRPTYRNFFPPDARWQFMGIRLAREV